MDYDILSATLWPESAQGEVLGTQISNMTDLHAVTQMQLDVNNATVEAHSGAVGLSSGQHGQDLQQSCQKNTGLLARMTSAFVKLLTRETKFGWSCGPNIRNNLCLEQVYGLLLQPQLQSLIFVPLSKNFTKGPQSSSPASQ